MMESANFSASKNLNSANAYSAKPFQYPSKVQSPILNLSDDSVHFSGEPKVRKKEKNTPAKITNQPSASESKESKEAVAAAARNEFKVPKNIDELLKQTRHIAS